MATEDRPDGSATRGEASAAFLGRLGEQVRSRRTALGLTVQQLSDRAGISRRMLTQIELGQANPSLATVDKIAYALDTDLPSLARDPRSDAVTVQPAGSAYGIWSSELGSRASLQTSTAHHPPTELWEWVLQPGDRYDAEPDRPGSEELFFVIDGKLTLEVEDLPPVTIGKGGSARLTSDRQYSYVNTAGRPCRYIRVVRLA